VKKRRRDKRPIKALFLGTGKAADFIDPRHGPVSPDSIF
jgi:hypothetical protein